MSAYLATKFPHDYPVAGLRGLPLLTLSMIRRTLANRIAWLEQRLAQRRASGWHRLGYEFEELAAVAQLLDDPRLQTTDRTVSTADRLAKGAKLAARQGAHKPQTLAMAFMAAAHQRLQPDLFEDLLTQAKESVCGGGGEAATSGSRAVVDCPADPAGGVLG